MKLIKKNIVKILKQDEKEIGRKYDLTNRENIISALTSLESELIFDFTIELRSQMGGGDYWFETEYYSEKIHKSIIYECCTQDSFESLEEFADYLLAINKEVNEFEASLLIKE